MQANANVISLSGGKDSTAMLLMLLERGENIADIVFFDGGWEFPQMHDHLEQLENFTGHTITRLRPRLPVGTQTEKTPFDWMFSEYPVIKRYTKELRSIGRGWPHISRRWCTGRKQESLRAHIFALTHKQNVTLPLQQCIGFAADEEARTLKKTLRSTEYIVQRYPLIEWGVTERDALAYCKKRGFTWGGLYEKFERVSCFCCPLQSVDDLRTLRLHYPALWQHMLTMESWLPLDNQYRRFKNDITLSDFETRLCLEGEPHES